MSATLHTDRLTLRAPVMADWPAVRDFYATPEAGFVGGPISGKSAWRMFTAFAGHWMLQGYGWFAMEDAEGLAGVCGLHHPPENADMEIGWITFPRAQGYGYATEAARAILAPAWSQHGPTRIVSYIDAGNAASQAVAAKLGASWDGEMAAHDPACQVWQHRRPQ